NSPRQTFRGSGRKSFLTMADDSRNSSGVEMENTMTATCTAKKISPMLAVADMEETLAFYHDVLGFTAMMKSAEYSIVERDGQTIHFMKAASEEVMRCVRRHTEIYIEVSNIAALW